MIIFLEFRVRTLSVNYPINARCSIIIHELSHKDNIYLHWIIVRKAPNNELTYLYFNDLLGRFLS